VRWHGRTDPTAYYREADVFIHLPELPDPLPTVVLEAQAWSLPVIAPRVGGISEIVIDGETGLLTSDADPGAAARVIGELSDDDLRGRLSMAARDRIQEHFSAQRYVEVFQEWIATLRAAPGVPSM
jgi:glycosyltransferase involved in cell wall biosynthesis